MLIILSSRDEDTRSSFCPAQYFLLSPLPTVNERRTRCLSTGGDELLCSRSARLLFTSLRPTQNYHQTANRPWKLNTKFQDQIFVLSSSHSKERRGRRVVLKEQRGENISLLQQKETFGCNLLWTNSFAGEDRRSGWVRHLFTHLPTKTNRRFLQSKQWRAKLFVDKGEVNCSLRQSVASRCSQT